MLEATALFSALLLSLSIQSSLIPVRTCFFWPWQEKRGKQHPPPRPKSGSPTWAGWPSLGHQWGCDNAQKSSSYNHQWEGPQRDGMSHLEWKNPTRWVLSVRVVEPWETTTSLPPSLSKLWVLVMQNKNQRMLTVLLGIGDPEKQWCMCSIFKYS